MTRPDLDSCPGVLRLHDAADGKLARIRVPGGQLGGEQLRVLAEAADELGDGGIELTARGNIQLRGVRDAAELTERLDSAGLLPSHTHERVRNIVASPLSGLCGGRADVRELVSALDAALRTEPRMAELSGRFLFALDDGRGDLAELGADLGVQATAAAEFALLQAGVDTGIRVPTAEVVRVLCRAAEAFLEVRGEHTEHWRMRDLGADTQRVVEMLGHRPTAPPDPPPVAPSPPVGWLEQDDGLVTLGAGVRFGALPARTALFLSAIERPLVITPWRGVLVTDLTEEMAEQVVRVLAPMGLIFDADSPWLQVSACTGRPGCAKARTDVRADATAAVESGRAHLGTESTDTAPPQPFPSGTVMSAADVTAIGRQHWSACSRRCGRPGGDATTVTATDGGYRIDLPAGRAR